MAKNDNIGAEMVLVLGILFARRVYSDNKMRARHKAQEKAEKAREEAELLTPLE